MKVKAKYDLLLAAAVSLLMVLFTLISAIFMVSEASSLLKSLDRSLEENFLISETADAMFIGVEAAKLSSVAIYNYDKKGLNDVIDILKSRNDVIDIRFFSFPGDPIASFFGDSVFILDSESIPLAIRTAVSRGSIHVEDRSYGRIYYGPVTYGLEKLGGIQITLTNVSNRQTLALSSLALAKEIKASATYVIVLGALLFFLVLLPLLILIQNKLVAKLILKPLGMMSSHIHNNTLEKLPDEIIKRDDEIGHFALEMLSLTQRWRTRQEEVEHQAFHDPLTGLPNRTFMRTKIEEWVEIFSAKNMKFAIMVIRVDGMSQTNQLLGHLNGDIFLFQVAGILNNILGNKQRHTEPVVGRTQGDEFTILLPIDSIAEANVVGKYIKEAVTTEFNIDKINVKVRASVAGLVYPDHGLDITELIRNSETAILFSKRSATKAFHLFIKGMSKSRDREALIVSELEKCIAERAIEMYYQPVLDLKTLEITGAEALARWIHPTLGFVPPDEFIPIAEANGLILPLSYLITDLVCDQRLSWRSAASDDFTIAINISPVQLTNPVYYNKLVESVYTHSILPRQIEIEITETAFLGADDEVFECLHYLRNEGFRIWLDDFGTGFSSLSHLQNYPVDGIKIDRSFVIDIESNATNMTLVSALVDLGSKLGKEIVAEGIETNLQSIILQRLGAHYAQGYHFDKPMTASAFEEKYLGLSE